MLCHLINSFETLELDAQCYHLTKESTANTQSVVYISVLHEH